MKRNSDDMDVNNCDEEESTKWDSDEYGNGIDMMGKGKGKGKKGWN